VSEWAEHVRAICVRAPWIGLSSARFEKEQHVQFLSYDPGEKEMPSFPEVLGAEIVL